VIKKSTNPSSLLFFASKVSKDEGQVVETKAPEMEMISQDERYFDAGKETLKRAIENIKVSKQLATGQLDPNEY
jgi:hypothetical protein